MRRFISADKLSKKERRKRNLARRIVWKINPVTRKPENPRAYDRRKAQKGEDSLF